MVCQAQIVVGAHIQHARAARDGNVRFLRRFEHALGFVKTCLPNVGLALLFKYSRMSPYTVSSPSIQLPGQIQQLGEPVYDSRQSRMTLPQLPECMAVNPFS